MKTLMLGILMGGLAIAASAPNFSGKWVLEVPGSGDRTEQVVLILNQVGGEVTGHLPPASPRGYSASPTHTEIWGGKAEGDTISFYVWDGRDQVAKVFYKGEMTGDEIVFEVTGGAVTYNSRGEPNPAPGPRQVKARRAQ